MGERGDLISHERLNEVVIYDRFSGEFTWKIKIGARCIIGAKLGRIRYDGYLDATIENKRYLLHRLAWLYVTGDWPRKQLDHKDGNRANNRFENLREATASQNSCNRQISTQNSSGIKGVYWHATNQKWCAQIKIAGRTKFLGSFSDIEKARDAYAEAARGVHGEFANLPEREA